MKKHLKSKHTLTLVIIIAIICWIVIGLQYLEVRKETDRNSPTVKDIPVLLYYYNQDEAQKIGDHCNEGAVTSINKEVPVTNRIIEDTISSLIEGVLTNKEQGQGFLVMFSNTNLEFKKFLLKDGVLTIELNENPEFKDDISCSADMFKIQIEKTAKQFPVVKEVIIEPQHFFQ